MMCHILICHIWSSNTFRLFLNSEHHQVQGVYKVQTCGLSIIWDSEGKKRGDIPWKKNPLYFFPLKVYYWNKSKLDPFLHKYTETFERDNGWKFFSVVDYHKNFCMVINRSFFYCKQSAIYWASQRSCKNQHFATIDQLSKTKKCRIFHSANWKWKSNSYCASLRLDSPTIFCLCPFPRNSKLSNGVGYFPANQKCWWFQV